MLEVVLGIGVSLAFARGFVLPRAQRYAWYVCTRKSSKQNPSDRTSRSYKAHSHSSLLLPRHSHISASKPTSQPACVPAFLARLLAPSPISQCDAPNLILTAKVKKRGGQTCHATTTHQHHHTAIRVLQHPFRRETTRLPSQLPRPPLLDRLLSARPFAAILEPARFFSPLTTSKSYILLDTDQERVE